MFLAVTALLHFELSKRYRSGPYRNDANRQIRAETLVHASSVNRNRIRTCAAYIYKTLL